MSKKATQKIEALLRLLNHLIDSQRRLRFSSIIKSRFNYCPIIWMFCSRTSTKLMSHFRILRKKVLHKIGSLSKKLNHVSDSQRRLFYSSLKKSWFNYYPFTWLYCSRSSNSMISEIYKGALSLILNYHKSDFDTLLQNNNDTWNYDHRNIKTLIVLIMGLGTLNYRPSQLSSILLENLRHINSLVQFSRKH